MTVVSQLAVARRVAKVAVVGTGTMGRRIAFGGAVAGKQVRLYDVRPGAAASARSDIPSLAAQWRIAGKITQQIESDVPHLISIAPSLAECVRDVDLVIESVPERLALKQSLFAAIDGLADARTLIASNSSAIPGSALAKVTARPDKVFNLNFGHLENRKVELMGHRETSSETMLTALSFVREIGLVPIVLRHESVGYAINRVWRATKKEVLKLLDRQVVTPEDIDRGWMLDWHVTIGPCGLMDKVGLDVVRDIELMYYEFSRDPEDRPPPLLDRMIADGKLGEKSGQGFYTYPDPAYLEPDFLERIPVLLP